MTEEQQIATEGTAVKVKTAEIVGKTAVLTAPETIEFQEKVFLEPTGNQLLVKIQGCGMCTSSLPVWEGRDWFNYPQPAGSPGHEAWGIVLKTGDEVDNIEPGQRVAILNNKGYATHALVDANSAVALPPVFEKMDLPGEPIGCAANVFHRSDIQKDQTVAIIGVGFLGALLIQLAKHAGARVIALSRRQSALDMAGEMGADEVIRLDDHYQIIEKVKKLTDGKFCERAIEATGHQWPVDLAAELTAVRGKLIIAGYHQDGLRNVNMQLWNWRGLDVINAHERDEENYKEGIREGLKYMQKGVIAPHKLIIHRLPFSHLEKAFHLLKERPEGFIKAVVTMEE